MENGYESWRKLKVGDKVYLPNEKRPYRVRCRDERYIICSKPMNLRHTVWYFIADMEKLIRGPDDRVFCAGYETDEQCLARLKQLQNGEIEVSWRHHVPLELSCTNDSKNN